MNKSNSLHKYRLQLGNFYTPSSQPQCSDLTGWWPLTVEYLWNKKKSYIASDLFAGIAYLLGIDALLPKFNVRLLKVEFWVEPESSNSITLYSPTSKGDAFITFGAHGSAFLSSHLTWVYKFDSVLPIGKIILVRLGAFSSVGNPITQRFSVLIRFQPNGTIAHSLSDSDDDENDLDSSWSLVHRNSCQFKNLSL